MDEQALRFWTSMGRAFAGAIIFALPLLMTMEMWWLGFSMDRLRLALLLLLAIPVLTALSHFIGFEATFDWIEDLRDAFIALAIGAAASASVLLVLAIMGRGDPIGEVLGKVVIQAVPASLGAMLARSQFGSHDDRRDTHRKKRSASYGGEIFIMAAGALYLGFSVAPTEEMILIAFQMSNWHGIALAVASLTVMHAFVYVLQFHGGERPDVPSFLSVLLRFSVAGYAVALLVSLYVLWTFGRTEDLAIGQLILATVVLGFPAALGAAAARVII